MGRPFKIELEDLGSTYQYAFNYCETEIKRLANFLLGLHDTPIIIVGSGGAYTVAKAFEYLHSYSQLSSIAKAVTPLELSCLALPIHKSGVILITANGNNSDIINAYKFINYCCPISFLTLCLNKKSKIKKLTDNDSTVFIGDRLPRGKDGYLAVNSILAFIVIIARAYNMISNSELYTLPAEFSAFRIRNKYGTHETEALLKESKIVLFGDFATPIAIDIESKFSEAALGNVLLADYRNFAHGRHFWLSRRNNSTSIISLITPINKQLSLKTIELIPPEISKIMIETTAPGVKGMVEVFLNSLYLVGCAGMQVGIDPGKPKVADFGKNMYHISHIPSSFKLIKKTDNLLNRAAYRKCASLGTKIFETYKHAFKKLKNMIKDVAFHVIIFDYDSTLVEKYSDPIIEKEIFNIINTLLCHNITVKIATGRGKSVRVELKEKISPQYWDKVIIGYYNGGIIAPLSDDKSPNQSCKENKALIQLAGDFDLIIPEIQYELRPLQLTIMMNDCYKFAYKEIIFEISRRYKNLKIFTSDHSIDIIPVKSSKLNLLDETKEKALCIGDSGQYGGNDYELLSSPYSLSVKKVSHSISSCWNYAPVGLNNTKATLYYLKQVNIYDRYFILNIK